MKQILKKLASFNAKCPPVKKASDNPFFKSKYASLDEIQKHIHPYLQAEGLVVVQANAVIDGALYVETSLFDADSAEVIKSIFPIVVTKSSSQEYGSAVSYAKRYSLTGILNLIVVDEDDDGNTSSQPQKETLSPDKLTAMKKYLEEGKIKEVEAAIRKYDLSPEQSKEVATLVNQAKAKAIKSATK